MTFEEVLDQALAMLQRRGRVTYQALQLQFELDDKRLEALKDDLLFSHCEITDEQGRGLVWDGEVPAQAENPQPETDKERLTLQAPTPTMSENEAKHCFMSSLSYWSQKTLESNMSLERKELKWKRGIYPSSPQQSFRS